MNETRIVLAGPHFKCQLGTRMKYAGIAFDPEAEIIRPDK